MGPLRRSLLVLAGISLVLAAAAMLECHSVVTAVAPNAPLTPSALYGLVLWGWWGLVAAAVWLVAERGATAFFSLRPRCYSC